MAINCIKQGLWLVLTCGALSAAAPPLVHQEFEEERPGWFSMGGEGKVQITHDPAMVKNGKGALEFRYEVSGAKPSIAVMPVTKPITGMKSMNFWMMSDSETATAITLVEKNGGRYVATFWLDANVWQRVELTPAEFILATGANDPKDPDGKLDLDQIEAVAILDISQIFALMAADNHAPIAIEDRSGAHKLWMDDFEISPDAPAWAAPKAAFLLEDFRAPQINWITMGGANLKMDSSGALIHGRAMRMDCRQMEERFVIVSQTLPPMDLTGATAIAFDIAAEKPAHLVVSFQEKAAEPEGPRYNSDLEVPGGNKVTHLELPIESFDLDDDGPADSNHKLDLDKLKVFSIVNVTGAYTGEDTVNTIRIGKIEGIKTATPQPASQAK